MRKRLFAVALLTALVALVTAPAASAGAPTQGPVTLEIRMDYDTQGGTFTTDAIVCPSGYAQDQGGPGEIPLVGVAPPFINEGYVAGASVLLKEHKLFTCDVTGDSFTLAFITVIHWSQGGTQGQWKVIEGTGAYANLKGNGTFKVEWNTVEGEPTLESWEGHMALG